jgi:hypothetical protein
MKRSRYNPSITFEQYCELLARKKEHDGRVIYKDLYTKWNVRQSTLATAIRRGIKQYDYKIWKTQSANLYRVG